MPDFVEYVPEESHTYTRPEAVMIRFPRSGVPGFGVSVDEFLEFMKAVKRGDYDYLHLPTKHERANFHPGNADATP